MMKIENQVPEQRKYKALELTAMVPYSCESIPGIFVYTGIIYLRFSPEGQIDHWEIENFRAAYHRPTDVFTPLEKVSISFSKD